MLTGKILNLADPDYRKTPGISKSALDQFARSPAHYKHIIIDGNRPEATPAMQIGSAFDTLLLTPELFAEQYVAAPDVRRGTKAWDEFEAAANGRTPLKSDELARLDGMVQAVRNHPAASALLSEGDAQVSYFWQDAASGLALKGRADFVRHDGIIVDVKTAQDASPSGFARSVFNFRYFVQAAYYLEAQVKTGGPTTDQFVFVVVEKEPPFAVAVYTLDPAALSLGFQTMSRDLARLADRIARDDWSAFGDAVQTISLPRYAFGGSDG